MIRKKAVKSDISLEERIKQLTCDIGDEDDQDALQEGPLNPEITSNADANQTDELEHAGNTNNNGSSNSNIGNGGGYLMVGSRDGVSGQENSQKYPNNGVGNTSDKSFSPNSSVSSSSSGSSAYKKISEIFNRDKKGQEKIVESEENPIVIIPQVTLDTHLIRKHF